MNIHLLSVTNAGSVSGRRPGLSFFAGWLPEMGFIPGALVQVLPEADGMVFNLCDENIPRYSELDALTKERGGKLIQAAEANIKGRETPILAVSGQLLFDSGLSFRDPVITKYEYGLIRIRKLPDTMRVIYMTSIKDQYTGRQAPTVKLIGEWLPGFGFTPDALATVEAEPGCITFTLRDDGFEKYGELVRFARQNKMKLIQVLTSPTRGKRYPYIRITGSGVDRAGFMPGDALLASCEHGLIKLQKLDFQKLGF